MKILYVITGLGVGGAEKVVCNLADQMNSRGFFVKIVYLTGEALVKPESSNIELIPLNLNSLSEFLEVSNKFTKIIKDFAPDIVHAHMVHANIFTRLNRIRSKIPKLICTAHNSNEGGKFRMLAYRATNFLSDINTNVSKEASHSLILKGAFNKNNLITVYNGVNLKKFDFSKETKEISELTFLSVGRLDDQKDYPNLFNAINILTKQINQKIKFFIVGEGSLRPYLEKMVFDLKISDNVLFLGKRTDIPDLLKKVNFFILSSKHEGLPTVVIEAMACGTFVIATNCGGSAEIMGDTGILVPPKNSKALAQALNEAINKTPQELKKNNLKARQRVEELFALDKSVENWLKIYTND